MRFFKLFQILHLKALFTDAMSKMRKKSQDSRLKKRQLTIEMHPWFNDMVEKLVLTGKREGAHEIEATLVQLIKGYLI